jgi:hypothetical protein
MINGRQGGDGVRGDGSGQARGVWMARGSWARGEVPGEGAAWAARFLRAGAAVKLSRAWATAFVLASCLALAACGGGGGKQKPAAPPKSDFEQSLDTVRRGSYVKIYVIRRTDGQPLAPEDKQYLRQNTPMETGMWVVTEDNRAAIAGAGFEFEQKHFEALSKRFTVEDYTNK